MIKGYYGKTYTVNYGGLEIEMTEEEYAIFVSRRPGGHSSEPPDPGVEGYFGAYFGDYFGTYFHSP